MPHLNAHTMLHDSRSARSIVAIVATCWMGAWGVLTGCGGASTSPDPPDLAATLPLGGEATLEVPRGTVIDREAETPVVWSSVPTATVVVTTSARDLPEQRIAIDNLHPRSTLQLRSVSPPSEQRDVSCESDLERTIDCTETPAPACTPATLEWSDEHPTRPTFVVDPAPCRRLEYRIAPSEANIAPLRFAAVGETSSLNDLAGILDEIEGELSIDLVLLLGDHAEEATRSGLQALAKRVRSSAVPVVVTPGEDELVDDALSAFQGAFGGVSLTWRLADVPFVTFATPRQRLSPGRVEEIRDRIREDVDDVPLVVTHTPPFDPLGVRGAGFRHHVQGGRLASVLTRRSVPLWITGHLPTREAERMGDTDLVVASSLESRQYTIFERTDDGWQWQRR